MRPEYLVRLDDACPTMDRCRWDAIETVLRRRAVKPIVAIVPANGDPELVRGPEDGDFWKRANSWADEGWMIALHGYSHVLRPSPAGIVRVNGYSEFVGLPVEEQRCRIARGVAELKMKGLTAEAWVAPAHGLDRLTLEALRSESSIRIISDSFARRPFQRWGFVWIPQQLWNPRVMPGGLWTICLHPNHMEKEDIALLEAFMDRRDNSWPDPHEVAARSAPYGVSDRIFEGAYVWAMRIRRAIARGKR